MCYTSAYVIYEWYLADIRPCFSLRSWLGTARFQGCTIQPKGMCNTFLTTDRIDGRIETRLVKVLSANQWSHFHAILDLELIQTVFGNLGSSCNTGILWSHILLHEEIGKGTLDFKGQLISECLFDFFKFSKKPTKNVTNFCPRI